MVQVLEVSQHRNGSAGETFVAAIVTGTNNGEVQEPMLVIQFIGQDNVMACAALLVSDVASHNIHFFPHNEKPGWAGWRGDQIHYEAWKAIKATLDAQVNNGVSMFDHFPPNGLCDDGKTPGPWHGEDHVMAGFLSFLAEHDLEIAHRSGDELQKMSRWKVQHVISSYLKGPKAR